MDNDHDPGAGKIAPDTTDEDTHTALLPRQILGNAIAILAQSHRFDFFWIGTFPSADTPGLQENSIANNWPGGLFLAYDAAGSFYGSDLVERLRDTVVPTTGEVTALNIGRRQIRETLTREFAQAGFKRLLAFSPYDANQQRYLLLLSGSHSATANLAAISYDATRFVDSYASNLSHRPRHFRTLSRRETECLRWAAAGKSSEEIAAILGISAHTVNFYLASAAQKLDCANRMHTIARALRYRLI